MAGINKPKTKYLSICSNNLVQIKSQKYFKIDKKNPIENIYLFQQARAGAVWRWDDPTDVLLVV